MNGIEELIKTFTGAHHIACTACRKTGLALSDRSHWPWPGNVVFCGYCGHTMVDLGFERRRDLTRIEAKRLAQEPGFDQYMARRDEQIKHLFG
jgi:hypothetical protein